MRYDFSPLYRSTIGFDRLFDLFEGQSEADASPGWPPYNVEKIADDAYRISVVAAGFTSDEIELVQKENELIVTGRKQAGDVTLTRAGRNSVAAVKFQAAAATKFHSAIALKR